MTRNPARSRASHAAARPLGVEELRGLYRRAAGGDRPRRSGDRPQAGLSQRGRQLRSSGRSNRKGRVSTRPFPFAARIRRPGLRSVLGVVGDHRLLRRRAADRDPAGLQRLRHDALQADMQQAVLQVRALDHDVVGQHEAALERTAGDAAIQDLALVVLGLDAAGDHAGCCRARRAPARPR